MHADITAMIFDLAGTQGDSIIIIVLYHDIVLLLFCFSYRLLLSWKEKRDTHGQLRDQATLLAVLAMIASILTCLLLVVWLEKARH